MRQDSCKYWFVVASPKLDQDLSLYPEVDLAVMHLDDGFYKGVSKNEHLRMKLNLFSIGPSWGHGLSFWLYLNSMTET